MASGQQWDPQLGRLNRTLALASFYGTGGLLCGAIAALPTWPGRDDRVLVAVGTTAVLTSVLLLAAGSRASVRICQALVALGSGLIALAIVGGGPGAGGASLSGFYVWVAVYSFLFFSVRAAVVQISLGLAAETVAVLSVGQGAVAAGQLMVSAGVMTSTGLVVGILMSIIRTEADTDSLTGLANRRGLDRELTGYIARAVRDQHDLAALLLDLDGFKSFNDTWGHAAGDLLLNQTADAWSAQVRDGDLLARLGGDEFVVILNNCQLPEALHAAQRLREVTPQEISVSVGIAMLKPGEAAAVLLSRADSALYRAKHEAEAGVAVAS